MMASAIAMLETACITAVDGGLFCLCSSNILVISSLSAVTCALLVLLVALDPRSWRERLWNGFASRRIHSVAVLPFVNVGANPNIEYLSDGVTDGIISSLSRIPDLRVMARSTVFSYKGHEMNAQKVGKDLNVDAKAAYSLGYWVA